ncbi:hypothetical protein TNIN_299481 [Trichonephila inaurata madagascariensis]|uniref:Uncharacterized protein n=1 Tax=Trichonephila inaurata madagascariensis TaxID=2747483 RepID=A0A8X6XPV1_9ARAC|nr:hypothetical protein TNIN_299481 [Trichonephila inaurata madagascariensis]
MCHRGGSRDKNAWNSMRVSYPERGTVTFSMPIGWITLKMRPWSTPVSVSKRFLRNKDDGSYETSTGGLNIRWKSPDHPISLSGSIMKKSSGKGTQLQSL